MRRLVPKKLTVDKSAMDICWMTFCWEPEGLDENPFERGTSFTTSIPHDVVRGISCPIACVFVENCVDPFAEEVGETRLFLGVIESKKSATTFEHTIRISTYAGAIGLDIKSLRLGVPKKLRRHFDNVLRSVVLHKGLAKFGQETGNSLWRFLQSTTSVESAIQFVENKLLSKKSRPSSAGGTLQRASLDDSLSIFEWGPSRQRTKLKRMSWVGDGDSEIRIYEDLAITQDASTIAGLNQTISSQTGVAVFEKGDEELTVITANKLPLERVFGVDLIYINEVSESIVLVQYKVLERTKNRDGAVEWRYRPDSQLRKEVARTDALKTSMRKDNHSFRISDEMHFFKFIKRTSTSSVQAGITISKNHFDYLSPNYKKTLIFKPERGGNYLRHATFCGLVRSGYIGSRPTTTRRIAKHIDAVLKEGHAIVLATQKKIGAGR